MAEEDVSENLSEESLVLEEEKFDVIYECLRCKVKVSLTELNILPEIKCICGFRVFTKVRPPIVKTIKAV
jgi:DNA-directed RNA polymerase subunit P